MRDLIQKAEICVYVYILHPDYRSLQWYGLFEFSIIQKIELGTIFGN
jgi:hypothetical protein